ncbi:MAG: S-layer protein domain-containing protein [Methanolobus sp.]
MAFAAVTANFTATPESGEAPLSVDFDASSSINATDFSWDFGDGNSGSGAAPTHTYNSAGNYTVVLTATNSTTNETGNYQQSVNVSETVVTYTPVADFSYEIDGFTVDFTEETTDADGWSWDFGDNESSTNMNPSHTYAAYGEYTVVLTATNSTSGTNDTYSESINVSEAPITPVADFSYDIDDLTVDFTDESTDADEWSWDFGDNESSTNMNPSHTYSSYGTYDFELTATNTSSGETDTYTDSITLNEPESNAPEASFDMNVTEGEAPLTVQFNDTSSSTPTSWDRDFGDGGSSDIENPVHTFVSTGIYNVTLEVSNGDGSDTVTETITAYAANYHTGDRIWDENSADDGEQSAEYYIWDAKSFSGFFYDLESGLSSENMTIYNIDRSIDDGDIEYQTSPVETDFDYGDWGSYQVIGFMAEQYFAGYTEDSDIDGVEEVSMISAGQLSKVLIDDDEKESVYSGSSLTLEEGYDLNIVEVDVNGNSVLVTLTKDGDELDTGVVSSGNDYIYKTDLGDADDVVVLAVHFDEVFSGTESNAVFINGIFQISDEYTEVEDGDNFGEMEVTAVSEDYIKMENEDSVSLSKGDSFTLMGNINIIVADNNDLRFAPYVDMTEPGTYELRGTVVEGEELIEWDPLNFEGFYYDIDEGIQTESLELLAIDGRTIEAGDLEYRSTSKAVEFEHSSWGDFEVIGFMAQKYFAGYTDATDVDGIDDDISLLSDGLLCKVLMDEDDKVSVYSGSSLVLEEGYSLDIIEVDTNGDRVLIELYQDGDEVDTGIASSGSDYVYETDIGDADDVPIIIVHFDEVFRGTESNAVFVRGIFQVSEDYIELEANKDFDEMDIDSFSDTSIVMSNDKALSLNKDNDIDLMGDVGIKVADSGTLRYYPYVEVVTEASESLSIELSASTVVEEEEVTMTVTARGASIGGVTIKVDGSTVGTTEDDGTFSYTPTEAGTYEITAEKDDYATGTEELEVIDADDETKKMSIEISPSEVYEGVSMTIFLLLQAIGGEGISDVDVTYDGKSIGSTGSNGSITYTATDTGIHKIVATKSGLITAEYDLDVDELAARFEYSNLQITPLEIKQGQEATISLNATNTGSANGSYTVDLKVNDVVVDSKVISLDIGESTEIEFAHEEDDIGTYKVEVGGLTKTYEVFERSGTIWYVLGAVGLVLVGGVAYLFTAGGWTMDIAQAKVGEAVEAIKEFVGSLR